MGLLDALGRTDVALLAGHDFGASVAAWAALIRPDIFHKLALMSAPFPGPPDSSPQPPPARSIHAELAALDRPRHYQWYYSTRQANAEMRDCPQGVHAFLRAYFHHKSADWAGNQPFRLAAWSAEELARMPTYYIMDRDRRWRRRWRRRCPAKRKQPPAAGCRMRSSQSMRGNTSATVSRAGCSGIAAARAGGSTGSTSCSPGAVSRFRPASSPARPTGAGSPPGGDGRPRRRLGRYLAGRRCRALGPAGAAGRRVGPAAGLCVGPRRFAPTRPPAAPRASTVAPPCFSVRSWRMHEEPARRAAHLPSGSAARRDQHPPAGRGTGSRPGCGVITPGDVNTLAAA